MSEVAAYESAIGAFIGSLEFRWVQPDDPYIVASNIDTLREDLEDLTPVLEGAKEVVVGDVEAHFREERGPNGEAWADWSESYAPVAAKTNIGKLRRRDTGYLYDAATDRSNYHVADNDLFVDTSDFPVYWAIQQYGGLIMSGATVVRRYGKRRRGEAGAADHGRIPARPYLGMSDEASLEVIGIFDQFVSGEILAFSENPLRSHALGRHGIMQPRLKSGRYGKIYQR